MESANTKKIEVCICFKNIYFIFYTKKIKIYEEINRVKKKPRKSRRIYIYLDLTKKRNATILYRSPKKLSILYQLMPDSNTEFQCIRSLCYEFILATRRIRIFSAKLRSLISVVEIGCLR